MAATLDDVVNSAHAYIAVDKPLTYQRRLTDESVPITEQLLADPQVRDAITAILKEQEAQAEQVKNPSGQPRNTTFFAGPLGSYSVLVGAQAQEFDEIRKNNIVVSFADLKKRFTEKTNIPCEPYANVRPMMSALYTATTEIARDKNASILLDDTLAPAQAEQERVCNTLAEIRKDSNLSVYAVALTPVQAREEATKLHMDGNEADRTARNFCAFFPKLCKETPNVTLYDKNMAVIYAQKDSLVVASDPAKLNMWRLMCGCFQEGVGQGASPPLPPRR